MSQEDKIPKEDGPTIDSLLKGSNWESRLAEARAKREKVLAAKAGAPAVQEAPEGEIGAEGPAGPQAGTPPMIKIKVKPKSEAPPLRAIRPEQDSGQTPQQSPPAAPRLRLRWIFLGVGIAACLAGALMLWMR